MIHLADATHVDHDTPRSRLVGIVAGNPAECLPESLHGGEVEIAISPENDTLAYTLLLGDNTNTNEMCQSEFRITCAQIRLDPQLPLFPSSTNLVADVTGFRPGGFVRQQEQVDQGSG